MIFIVLFFALCFYCNISSMDAKKCITLSNLDGKIITKIEQSDFDLLKIKSQVIGDQINFSSDTESSIVYLPNDINKHHINLLRHFLRLKSLKESVEFHDKDLFDLLYVCDRLDLKVVEELEIFFKVRMDNIVNYCIDANKNYEELWLSEDFKRVWTNKFNDFTHFVLLESELALKYLSIGKKKVPASSLTMSRDGKKILAYLENDKGSKIHIYNINELGEVNCIGTLKNIQAAGMSADGSTLMVLLNFSFYGKPTDIEIKWYEITEKSLTEKGQHIFDSASAVTDSEYRTEPCSGRDLSGELTWCGGSRFLRNIFLSEDGKRAFLKVPKVAPLCILLDDKKKKCIDYIFLNKSYQSEYHVNNIPCYQQMIAMSSLGICAWMNSREMELDVDQIDRKWAEIESLSIDEHEKHRLLWRFKKELYKRRVRPGYFCKVSDKNFCYDKKHIPLIDSLSIDENARHILKIEEDEAQLAYIQTDDQEQEETFLTIPNDLVSAGALSLDGKTVVLGGASGSLSFYDTNIRNHFWTFSKSQRVLNPSEKYFDLRMYKFRYKNPQSSVAIATNEGGDAVVVSRESGSLDYYSNKFKDYRNELVDLDNLILSKLISVYSHQKSNDKKRPLNIASFYLKLPIWIQNFAKKNLNVRTGWGPRATLDLIQNENVSFYYKCEAVAPYIIGTASVATVCYAALRYLNK